MNSLLVSLLRQKFSRPWEIILVNNWPNQAIKLSSLTVLGRTLKQLADLTVVNLSRNEGCAVRFSLAGLAKYDTIMFLDDDVEILSLEFMNKFYEVLSDKNSVDIISGWCSTFEAGRVPDYYKVKNYTFLDQNQPQIEVDLVGAGMCMFKKQILFSKLADIPDNFRDADNVWLSMMSTLLFKGRKYYVPCSGLVRFHKDHANSYAMYKKKAVDNAKRQAVKDLYKLGYVPLYARRRKS